MALATISLEVDADLAQLTPPRRPRNNVSCNFYSACRLRELTEKPVRSLKEVMDDIGREAEAKGLTPEILESLLNEQ